MSLRVKLCLLGVFVALFVGVFSAVMFARSWRDLAQTYALSGLDLRLRNFDAMKEAHSFDEEWAFEVSNEGVVTWAAKPRGVSDSSLKSFEQTAIRSVSDTRLQHGTFEITLPLANESREQEYVVSFENRSNESRTLIAGVSSETSLRRFSAWAAPFLGIILAAIVVAILVSFLITNQLNQAYLKISSGLRAIGSGNLNAVEIPESSDPAILGMATALKETIGLLKGKDATIKEQHTTIEKVSTLVNEDPLTGISNRRAFEDFIEGLMSGTFIANSVPVMGIIDLDHFKKINDTYGHSVGDFVLKETTRIITECIRYDSNDGGRSPDFFARIGGEEFVVIFTSVRMDSVHIGAERILRKLKTTVLDVPAEITSDGKSFKLSVSASIGLALWGKERFSREEWIKEADEALYEAKCAGRGRIVQLKPDRREWL